MGDKASIELTDGAIRSRSDLHCGYVDPPGAIRGSLASPLTPFAALYGDDIARADAVLVPKTPGTLLPNV